MWLPFLRSFSSDSKNTSLSKCNIGSLMPFPHSFSLDIISTKRQKVLMDVRKWVLLSSNYFPSITESTIGKSTIGYCGSRISPIFIDFMISIKAEIPTKHKFLVGNSILVSNSISVLDLVVKILVLVGFTLFLVLDLMVKNLVTFGSSPFSIRILIIAKS